MWDDGTGPSLCVTRVKQLPDGPWTDTILRWRAGAWHPLLDQDGFTQPVRALALYDDGNGERLYAAGDFRRAGSVEVNYVARWNGNDWEPLGEGMWGYPGTNPAVRALASFDDGSGKKLYASGTFNKAGGVPANCIARWNGRASRSVP